MRFMYVIMHYTVYFNISITYQFFGYVVGDTLFEISHLRVASVVDAAAVCIENVLCNVLEEIQLDIAVILIVIIECGDDLDILQLHGLVSVLGYIKGYTSAHHILDIQHSRYGITERIAYESLTSVGAVLACPVCVAGRYAEALPLGDRRGYLRADRGEHVLPESLLDAARVVLDERQGLRFVIPAHFHPPGVPLQ